VPVRGGFPVLSPCLERGARGVEIPHPQGPGAQVRGPAGDPPEGPSARDEWRPGPYAALTGFGLIPLLVLAVFAYLISARAVESLVHQGNDAAASITAALVEREFDHWIASLTSHAGFPALSAAVAHGDVPEVRRRLEIFVTAYGRLDRAFVSDTTGLLWVDFPEAPESLGRRFDDREWFRGVSETRRPYVSGVYRRHAHPRIQVVAVAVPVRHPDSGELVGYLVGQVRLDGLSDLLDQVEVGEGGFALLRDHEGVLAAHPTLDLPAAIHREYADLLPLQASSGEAVTRGRYTDPNSGDPVLASSVAARVGDHVWTVISQQPIPTAFAPIRGLALRLGGAGALVALLMGGLLIGVFRENTRRREAETELVKLNRELEQRVDERTRDLREKEDQLLQSQKMEAVGRLAGGVAHDFNNLLTVVLGCADLLRTRFAEGTPEREEIEDVRSAAESAADLTRQLLAFSRKQVMQPEVLDVNDCVIRMGGILERVLGEDIDLVWKLTSVPHPVKFDPGQIEQVILNLAVNARDAMPEGGKLTIETANVELDEGYVAEHVDAQPGPHVMLAVSDTGVGMDPDTCRRVFEPFFTTKRLGRGTGLGLSTVHGIVQQGGGNIWVYSEPDRGTTFKVYLPRTDEVPQEPVEPTILPEAPGQGTILLVEDEEPVRKLLARILRGAGYQVFEAGDAASALNVHGNRRGEVDLLLTDVVLPDLGGPELAARLGEAQPGLSVLYMSGYTDNAIVHHGVLDEGTAFVQKPLRPGTLLEKVRDMMRGIEA
jgi:signal transduction histidine kinase/CheY-like chemotaxis protein